MFRVIINEASIWIEMWSKIRGKKTFYSGLEYLQPHYSCIERENMASSLIKKSLLSLLNVPPKP